MTSQQLGLLKADYLEWSGGCEPDAEEDIAVYVEYTRPYYLDKDDVTEALRTWWRETEAKWTVEHRVEQISGKDFSHRRQPPGR